MKHNVLALCALLAASAGFAHTGVQDPQVLARMEGMTKTADAFKIVGLMARGETPFDADIAQAAITEIGIQAARIDALFAEPADDPKSEAKAIIWSEYDQFLDIASTMENRAQSLANAVTTPQDLRLVMSELGATCKSCHERYRD